MSKLASSQPQPKLQRNSLIRKDGINVLFWNANTFNFTKFSQLLNFLEVQYSAHNTTVQVVAISEARLNKRSFKHTEKLHGKYGSYTRYYYPLNESDIQRKNSDNMISGGLL